VEPAKFLRILRNALGIGLDNQFGRRRSTHSMAAALVNASHERRLKSTVRSRDLPLLEGRFMSDLVVHVIPRHDHINLYYPSSRLVHFGERIINDTADMVSQLESMVNRTLEFSARAAAPRVRPTRRVHNIAQLIITGHGTPSSFRVGSDRVTLAMLQDDSHDVPRQLRRLGPLFTRSALVVLRACETGQNEALLQALSSVLGGVRVQASEDSQFGIIRGVIGDVVECRMDTCRAVD
jgi:hypothetical protein